MSPSPPVRPSVLFVDDDPLMLRTLARLVRDLPLEAAFAESAAEALAMMARSVPSALITDHRMPHTTGLELVQTVRERYPDVRCFLHTGADLSKEELPDGVPLLRKPFRPDTLRQVMEALSGPPPKVD